MSFLSRIQNKHITHGFLVLTALMFAFDLWVAIEKWNDGWSWFLAVIVGMCVVCQAHLARRTLRMRMAHAVDHFDEPIPPQNVQLRRSGGEVLPMELVYIGRDPEGLHTWLAVTPVALEPGDVVTADMVGENTAIIVQAAQG